MLFALLSSKLAPPVRAQGTPTPTPTPTCTATPTITPDENCEPFNYSDCDGVPHSTPSATSPPAVPIPTPYQPDDGTDTKLYWRVWEPDDGSSWPAILILHEGHFAAGSIYGGTIGMIASELSDLGYVVFVGDYRLAPCGLIEGQTVHDDSEAGKASGRPIQQKNDIKALIGAIRDDDRCNGWLGVIGGSSGATHAAWAAIDQTVSTEWPVWDGSMRPDAVACLSGAYDFSDRSVPGSKQQAFVERVENYTNKCDRLELREESIVRLIENSPTNIKPIYAINAENDQMPLPQLDDLRCALETRGVSASLYETHVIPDNPNHAFGYWYDWDGVSSIGGGSRVYLVGERVEAFFAAHQ